MWKRFAWRPFKPMKLRILTIAVVLAVGAVATWLWMDSGGDYSATPNAADTAESTEISRKAPRSDLTDEVAPSARSLEPSVSPANAKQPEPPVRISTSVVPGMPMGRGGSAPPRPPAAVGPGAVSRAERQIEGKAELAKVQAMLRDFRTRMGENPVGSNAEIMRAVMGGNPAGARLGPPEGQEVNPEGELVDQWGTPYFFHQLSKNSMEVRSAGPDRKMWTTDDVVAK